MIHFRVKWVKPKRKGQPAQAKTACGRLVVDSYETATSFRYPAISCVRCKKSKAFEEKFGAMIQAYHEAERWAKNQAKKKETALKISKKKVARKRKRR